MDTHRTTTASSSSGIGFASLLTIVFIVLKLIGVIDWSWIWVLAPLWISVALTVVLLLIIGAVTLVFASLKSNRR